MCQFILEMLNPIDMLNPKVVYYFWSICQSCSFTQINLVHVIYMSYSYLTPAVDMLMLFMTFEALVNQSYSILLYM